MNLDRPALPRDFGVTFKKCQSRKVPMTIPLVCGALRYVVLARLSIADRRLLWWKLRLDSRVYH